RATHESKGRVARAFSFVGRASARRVERVPHRRLVPQAEIDLARASLVHVGGKLRDVRVELLVPLTVEHDRTVTVAQERIVDAHLVVPDLHVLAEALRSEIDV